tara:strand:+ start:5035 stop:6156 length:1122 start_codon:yes stop_codon:yes gene_type:complete
MSIIAYTGLPGSGKSYGVVVEVLMPAIKSGRRVYTNIPLKRDAWMERYGACPEHFDIQDLIDNPSWFQDVLEPGSICVIDELWRLWPSGLKANQVSDAHKSILAEHRHMVGDDGFATEIVFVTQDLGWIAMFARSLVEFTYRSVKLSVVGQEKRFRIDVYQGPVAGPSPPAKSRVRQLFRSYKPENFDFYYSHTMSSTGEAGVEEKPDKRYNMLKSSGIIGRLIFALILSVIAVWGLLYVSDDYGADGEEQTAAVDGAAAHPAPQYQPVQRRPAPPRHDDPLSGRDLSIIWNNQHGDVMEYRLSVENNSGGYAELGFRDLVALKYTIKPVTQCMLILSINGSSRTVTCRRPEEPSRATFGIPLPSLSSDGEES